MEKIVAFLKRKHRVIRIENVYFVQSKSAILPWKNKYITTDKDRALQTFKLLTGSREIIAEAL